MSKTTIKAILILIVLAVSIMCIAQAKAYTDMPFAQRPGFVDSFKMPYSADIQKFYDPYTNIVCYSTGSQGYGGGDISCLKND